jgi:hypothetical protein
MDAAAAVKYSPTTRADDFEHSREENLFLMLNYFFGEELR